MSEYLTTFFQEKDLPEVTWELEDRHGTTHIISTEVVKEAIFACSPEEQRQIENMIRRIDFYNGDVNDYLKHLAGALINAERGGENI